MRSNLIFSRDARGSRLYRVSPLLFPQEQLENFYLLPKDRDLPEAGLKTTFHVFDFGFADPNKVIAPYDTAYFGYAIASDFLATALTGISATLATKNAPVAGAAGAQQTPSYLFNFLQTHNGNQRQWANKDITDVEGLGRGEDPLILRAPVLVPKGDILTCVVRNMGNSSLQVQIMLTGGEF